MDVLATYGPMAVGAVLCGVVAMVFLPVGVLGLSELDYEIPGPWVMVAIVTTIALPVVAFVGAAVLIGPSSDVVNFVRAGGGVLAGLAAFFGLQTAGLPRAPQQFKVVLRHDGRVLTDAIAVEHYNAHRTNPAYQEVGWNRLPGWEPSATFVARFVLFVCILPPVAGVVVAVLVADWH